MHILVTGATGFLGRRCIKLLVARGYKVTALSRQSHALKTLARELSIPYIGLDILYDSLEKISSEQKIDAVIHLAWGNLSQYNDICHETKYPQKHLLFLQYLVSLGINNFTIIGTSLEYGLLEGALKEDMPCQPVTAYGKGKLDLYERFSAFCHEKSLIIRWLRLFYMYADDQAEKTLWGQLHKAHACGCAEFAMSQGDQERDYLHADTVADMIICASLQNHVQGVINVGSGEKTQVMEMVQKFMVENKASFHLSRGFYPYPAYEPFSFWANTEKLRTFYSPVVDVL